MVTTKPSLQVLDSRSGQSYTIPIHDGDYISAEDIGQIIAPGASTADVEDGVQNPHSLRILDRGFQYTACTESSITFMYVNCSRSLISLVPSAENSP